MKAESGPPRMVSDLCEEKIFRPRSKDGPAKNIYTKSEKLTLSCRVTWDWSERLFYAIDKY
jgi:hypothetical protein